MGFTSLVKDFYSLKQASKQKLFKRKKSHCCSLNSNILYSQAALLSNQPTNEINKIQNKR